MDETFGNNYSSSFDCLCMGAFQRICRKILTSSGVYYVEIGPISGFEDFIILVFEQFNLKQIVLSCYHG